MSIIEAPDFEIASEVQIIALQGDWDVRAESGPQGGRLVVIERAHAHQTCLRFMDAVVASTANMALLPELAIPRDTVPELINRIKQFPRSLVFIGGIEGLTPDEYKSLLNGVGVSQPLEPTSAGSYVNSMLVVVKTATVFAVHARAKRVASGAENQGPPLIVGAGPFTVVRIGTPSVTIVPLICAEFVWPEKLWKIMEGEGLASIDYVPVLQRNSDIAAKHTGPMLHAAYTQGGCTAHARFLFINQAVDTHSDGTCYVVVPPTAPSDPSFDHSLHELWYLPGVQNYKGFRVPDLTGCVWAARITNPSAGTSALRTRFCSGGVTEVLTPSGAPLRGLSVGLMRSAARWHHDDVRSKAVPSTPVHGAMLEALDRANVRYVLTGISTEAANDVFYRMCCKDSPSWAAVESVVRALIEAAALLASGGDTVVLTTCGDDNCSFLGKPVAILYAPDVDLALAARFSAPRFLEATTKPAAVVLIGVDVASTQVNAKKVGDVLRSDRVTSRSPELLDAPGRTEETSTTIRADDIDFRDLKELRPNIAVSTNSLAKQRLGQLFPGIYA